MCEISGCQRPVNKDGLCFPHKIKTVSLAAAALKAEREGTDVTEGRGTTAYVQEFYERRRAAGMHDMEPENSKAARYVPKMPIGNRKKLRELNNGL